MRFSASYADPKTRRKIETFLKTRHKTDRKCPNFSIITGFTIILFAKQYFPKDLGINVAFSLRIVNLQIKSQRYVNILSTVGIKIVVRNSYLRVQFQIQAGVS